MEAGGILRRPGREGIAGAGAGTDYLSFMALQDLTPQLRTRLSHMERAVGWFVFLATALLLFCLGYYVYNKAESKGWGLVRARYYTYVKSAAA